MKHRIPVLYAKMAPFVKARRNTVIGVIALLMVAAGMAGYFTTKHHLFVKKENPGPPQTVPDDPGPITPATFLPSISAPEIPREEGHTGIDPYDFLDIHPVQVQGTGEEGQVRDRILKERYQFLTRETHTLRTAEKGDKGKASFYRYNRSKKFDVNESIASYPTDLTRVLTVAETIPVILETEIQSWLPSENVRARVERDVYAHEGYTVLIGRGSTIIGRYKPLKKIGDRQLAIQWYRIITTDHININIDAKAEGELGVEGVTGDVNNRFLTRFGVAGLVSIINAAANYSVNVYDEKQLAAANAASGPLAEVTAQSIQESFNIAPIVEIPYGEPMKVQITQDIRFPEPEGKTIHAQFL